MYQTVVPATLKVSRWSCSLPSADYAVCGTLANASIDSVHRTMCGCARQRESAFHPNFRLQTLRHVLTTGGALTCRIAHM